MRALILSLFFSLSLMPAAHADEAAIQGVIGAQIEALRADDFGTAFEFASPTIKRLFGSPERFGMMVQRGYPMVWRPGKVEYLEAKPEAGAWRQDVLITDGSGALHVLAYRMIQTPAGWQIDGVQLLEAPQPMA